MARSRKWGRALVATAIVLGVAAYFVTAAPAARSIRDFEPDRLADLETRMWQAYYAKSRLRLFGLLVTMLREQYGYSWARAAEEGFHLARAAATFGDARSNYEKVLPDLEHAYRTAKEQHGAGFDPVAVAKAELAWWVARRVPEQNSPQQIGDLIADEYALLYEVPKASLVTPATRRAEAGWLRDQQGATADWSKIHQMLQESYRGLRAALAAY